MQIENFEASLGTIDFDLLKEQKKTLLSIIDSHDKAGNVHQVMMLEGILNLIDAVQDAAVEVYGMSIKDVFNLSND